MNCSKQRHDGGAYRRCKTMIVAHAKEGKDRSALETGVLDADFCRAQIEKYRTAKGNVYAGWG